METLIFIQFVLIVAIVLFVLEYTKVIDSKKFISDIEPYFKFLMEDDYKFLVAVKYGENANADVLFDKRVKTAGLVILVMIFYFLMTNFKFMYIIVAFIIGFVVFKLEYTKLSNYYKKHLHAIDSLLPYYLKSLEILIQHYTVPVAIRKSIDTAPEIFKSGLNKLVSKIEEGDSSVDPYMDFAKEYPVRDSMRMMRLLYRLSLGSQENKQEQLIMFAKNVSSLQNKSREQKYANRLENMEKRTTTMLMCTGGGILVLLMIATMSMMNI